MHLFSDYIHPLTLWFYDHPHMALLITFLISFSESLAVIGSFIPGSVAMTAIGLLAGSGVMRIDLTFLAAILGAIAGDGISYVLGYIMSDRLSNLWPFKKYPSWLEFGKKYFAKHGASSIIIGRFIGPMRSVIPVIAGMMHMNRWHFILANIVSGVIWASLYIFPGILIGAASSELSAESSTRLFVLILLLLIIIWLTSMLVKWLLGQVSTFLKYHLHHLWIWLEKQPRFAKFTKGLAPKNEANHHPTAALTIILLLSFIISVITICLVVQGNWVATINNPVYLFFQSLRTQSFDSFFIFISLVIGPIPLLTLVISFCIYLLYYQDWRTLRYWLMLCFTSGIAILLLSLVVYVPEPNSLLRQFTPLSFPATDLTLATSLFGFTILYTSTHYHTVFMLAFRILLVSILLLAGIALAYLGDNWITSVIASYFIGISICLLHWINYRRKGSPHHRSQLLIVISCLLLTTATYISYHLYSKKMVHAHLPQHKQYVITEHIWWNQQRPLLPIYSTNRIGKRTGLLNIQYVGSLAKFQQALELYGWKHQSKSFFYTLLLRAGGNSISDDLPLMAQLYMNRKPALMMTYQLNNEKVLLVLRLWRSNFHLRHYHQPIWIGSLIYSSRAMKTGLQPYPSKPVDDYLVHALDEFDFHQIKLPMRYLESLPYPASPVLLMIKEPPPLAS